MAYILNKTNGSILVTVQDASIDQTTDLKFLGRNYAGYGEFQNENFIRLLENFANTTEPPKPIEGQIWYDSANKKLNVYNSSNWKGIANLEITEVNPYLDGGKTPSLGDLWYYTAGEQLFAYNGTDYVLIGPPTGADKQAGWRGDFEKDVADPSTPIYNIKAVIGADVVSVVSNQEYEVYADASGTYPIYVAQSPALKLYKGINLIGAHPTTGVSATVDGYNAYSDGIIMWGTAAHSINANFATKSGTLDYSVSSANLYKPVAFLNTTSNSNATVSIDYGFTYNPSTNFVKATRFEGVSTSALYADLAERYAADDLYPPGTVLVIGGEKEVTVTETRANTAVIGIVSEHPGYIMNAYAGNEESKHPCIALKGRVPCKVVGTILKGNLLVTSTSTGYAEAFKEGDSPNAVIGKALESHLEGSGVIEVLVV